MLFAAVAVGGEAIDYETRIFKYISAQNIDRGYSLEPPHGGGSNE